MTRCYKKRFRAGSKCYLTRLKKLQEMFCSSISSNVTSLTLGLTWPCGFLWSKRGVYKVPRKFVLHGLHVECKDDTCQFHWNGLAKKKSNHLPPTDGLAKKKSNYLPLTDANQLRFLKVIQKHKIQSILSKSWPSFENVEHDEICFWMKRWYKHGCKIGMKLIEYLKMSLYLRRLFTTGLNLKINRPMKAETLIKCIKDHLRANFKLDATPRIKCRLIPNLFIPLPTRKIQRLIFRRRLYVLEEIQLSVDPKSLEFVSARKNSYQGHFKEKSLVILPYFKELPVTTDARGRRICQKKKK